MKSWTTEIVNRWIVASIIALVTIGFIVVSMRMNYLFNTSMAQAGENAALMGYASILFDFFKATLLTVAAMLMRLGLKTYGTIAFGIWLWCLAFGTASAIGFASRERNEVVGGREGWAAVYEQATKDLSQEEARRSQLKDHRSQTELEAAIASQLSRVVTIEGTKKVLGTVAIVTSECIKPDRRTIDDCNKVAGLREELGVAVEAARLDRRIDELKHQVETARDHGGTIAANPQAEILSWLTYRFVSVKDASFGWAVFFGVLLELASAFGLTLAFQLITGGHSKKAREKVENTAQAPQAAQVLVDAEMKSTIAESGASGAVMIMPATRGVVKNYLVECTDLSDENSALGVEELYADYRDWCRRGGVAAAGEQTFVADFDTLRDAHALEVKKFGTRYYGLRLRSLPALRTASSAQRRRRS